MKESSTQLKKFGTIINLYSGITLNEFGHIYFFENKINDKKYVGQSIIVLKRLYSHISCRMKDGSKTLVRAIKKYGIENFNVSIIDFASDIDELNEKEIRYIKEFKSNNRECGYNIESGGKNSPASEETRKLLSKIRKNIKQTPEWVGKRIKKVSKPVIKLNKIDNKIIDEFTSLADAGRKNKDGLSYGQIERMINGKAKGNDQFIYCYKEDYENGNLPEYKTSLPYRKFETFTSEELDKMYDDYKTGASIREISKNNRIYFSTISKYIKNKETNKVDNNSLNINEYNTAICKKTEKEFKDVINKSGALTNHIRKIYPDIQLESKFKRKQIEIKTGKPWYYEYFQFE